MTQIYPRALQKGDKLAIVVPGSPVDREKIERAIRRYEELGFGIKTYGDLYRQHGYLAGEDTTRAEELMAAFADPEVSAVLPARGGTGITRLLERLDYDVIRENPKIFAGFSDNSALHLAIQKMTGLVTFHTPHLQDGLGHPDGMTERTVNAYRRALMAEQYHQSQQGYVVPLSDEAQSSLATLFPGVARGRLVGGNLSLIGALMGTPYDIETEGKILLLEDVDEAPYRIDRMLSQLRLAGKLCKIAGVLLGQFTDCNPPKDKPSLSLDQIFHHYFKGLNVPVIRNFPTGHTRDNVTLPLNAEVELDADRRCLMVLENPVTLSSQ